MKKRSIFPDHLCPYCKSCRISHFKRGLAFHLSSWRHPHCPRCGAELKMTTGWIVGNLAATFTLFITTWLIVVGTGLISRCELLFYLPLLIVGIVQFVCNVWGKLDYEEDTSHPKPPVYVAFKYVDPPAIEIVDNQCVDTPKEGENTDGTDCGN